MTKIAEKTFWDENKMIVQETHDFSPVVNKAKALKSAGQGDLGNDNKLVGLIPMKLWHEWAKDAGVKASDTKAMREIVARKMNDSEYAHLRVWEGRY